jgi:DNA-binding HxlR family transcriptional regulator
MNTRFVHFCAILTQLLYKICFGIYSVAIMTAQKTVGCVKAATEIIGDKWTPQLLRFFINEGSVRFCQLQDLANGINPRTLSARLDRLEELDIIEKTPRTSLSRCEYRLTPKGVDLIPIIANMEVWSKKYTPVLSLS